MAPTSATRKGRRKNVNERTKGNHVISGLLSFRGELLPCLAYPRQSRHSGLRTKRWIGLPSNPIVTLSGQSSCPPIVLVGGGSRIVPLTAMLRLARRRTQRLEVSDS